MKKLRKENNKSNKGFLEINNIINIQLERDKFQGPAIDVNNKLKTYPNIKSQRKKKADVREELTRRFTPSYLTIAYASEPRMRQK